VQIHPTGHFDNSPLPAKHIEVVPLAAAMGAEIRGVDVARITDAQFAEVEQALFRHKMVYFRGQQLTHADHEAFSLRLGPFAEDAYTSGIAGHPNVHPLIKEADDQSKHVFGEGWHTDSPFLAEPPSITLLYSRQIPPWGGDTIWANAALAYASLSDGYRKLIDGLRVHFSIRDVLSSVQRNSELRDSPTGRLAQTRGAAEYPADLQRKIRGNFHPLVRVHARTGEKSLYVDGSYAIGIEGLTDEEARPILDYLVGFIVQHAFTCRLRWEVGTLAMWDNRLCLHQAFNDYQGWRREMYRTTVAGEKPRSACTGSG
jgi:alpha-ketoglutarate-dependent taurine dioxygenase